MQIKVAMHTAEAANKLKHIPYTGTNGLYSAVVPTPGSIEAILKLADELELSPDEDALHATVIYSKKAPSDSVESVARIADSDYTYNGVINAVEHWVGHNGKTYIVLKLVCAGIVLANASLQRMGAEHTFVPFSPHITLSDEVPVDDAMKARIDFVNKRLAFDPIEVKLINQIVGDLE